MCTDLNPNDPTPMPIPMPGGTIDPWACVGSDCRIIIVSVKKARVIEFSFSPDCTPEQQRQLLHRAEKRLKESAESVRGTCPRDCVCVPFADAGFRDSDPLEIHVRPFLVIDPHDPHCFIAVEKASVVIVVSVIDGVCAPLQLEGPGGAVGPDGPLPLDEPQKFPPSVLKRVVQAW